MHKYGTRVLNFPLSAGIRQGIDEDDLVAVQLGKAKAAQLTDVQQKYKDRLKEKLAQVLVGIFNHLSVVPSVVSITDQAACQNCSKQSCSAKNRLLKTNSSHWAN